jgi:hypothetical protein
MVAIERLSFQVFGRRRRKSASARLVDLAWFALLRNIMIITPTTLTRKDVGR